MTSWFKSRLFLMWSNIANDYTTVHVDLLCTNGIYDFFSLNTEYNRKKKNNKWKNTWMSGVAGKSPNYPLEGGGGGRGGGGAAGTAIGLSQLILARMKESSRKPFRKRTLALCRANWCRLSRSAFVQMESRRAMSVPLSWLLWDALALDFTHYRCQFHIHLRPQQQRAVYAHA